MKKFVIKTEEETKACNLLSYVEIIYKQALQLDQIFVMMILDCERKKKLVFAVFLLPFF